MPGKIFVNYRRDDERSAAARVRDRLALAFGKSNVFMDVDNLIAGQRFDKELENALAETDIFLAVMGPRWLELFRERQASGERDYVREEIAAALKRGIVVIPVLIERATLPRGDELTEDIRQLVLHQKHTVVHEQFGRDVDGLIEAIKFSRKSTVASVPMPSIRVSAIGWAATVGIGLAAVAGVAAYTAGVPIPWSLSVQQGPTAAEIAAEKARADVEERQRLASLEIEKERQARAEAQAEAKRQADLAAKAQSELEARQKADAEAKRKADEAERKRQDALKAEEERQRAAAEAERKKAEEAARHDPALAVKPGSGQSFKDKLADGKPCPMCPEMVVAPSGSFTMGSPGDEPEHYSGETQLRITIAKPFAVGRYAVTFDEWDACVAAGGCNGYKPNDSGWGRGLHPVINVNWDDATAYVAWLSKTTGKPYRLLSEAEREYVTRAGTTTPFWWGKTINTGQANYNGTAYPSGPTGGNRGQTLAVNSFEPNPWGLYNVHGNVYDWAADCWNQTNSGNPGDGTARLSGDCSRRVVRGGSWSSSPQYLRSAYRIRYSTGVRYDDLGFRVGRTLAP